MNKYCQKQNKNLSQKQKQIRVITLMRHLHTDLVMLHTSQFFSLFLVRVVGINVSHYFRVQETSKNNTGVE